MKVWVGTYADSGIITEVCLFTRRIEADDWHRKQLIADLSEEALQGRNPDDMTTLDLEIAWHNDEWSGSDNDISLDEFEIQCEWPYSS
jgi:hypothetical protein